LQRFTIDCKAYKAAGREDPSPQTVRDFERIHTCGIVGGSGSLFASGITMADLAYRMRAWLHAPVIDRTGLEGAFEVALTWNQDPLNDASDPSQPILPIAVREQLGLKLEQHPEPIDVLVIDRIRRPDEN
jgi:uncharacterized protein (TIGR03435 family)